MEPVKIDLVNLRSFEIFLFPSRFLLIKGMAPGAYVCVRDPSTKRGSLNDVLLNSTRRKISAHARHMRCPRSSPRRSVERNGFNTQASPASDEIRNVYTTQLVGPRYPRVRRTRLLTSLHWKHARPRRVKPRRIRRGERIVVSCSRWNVDQEAVNTANLHTRK